MMMLRRSRRKIKNEEDISDDGSGVVQQTGVPTARCCSLTLHCPVQAASNRPALPQPLSNVAFSIGQVFDITMRRLYTLYSIQCIQALHFAEDLVVMESGFWLALQMFDCFWGLT